jgi:aspartate kinase
MIIMKFGGTSVKDVEAYKRVIEIIRDRIDRKPVVVLSATAGTTDSLIECSMKAKEGFRNEAKKIITEIYERHVEIASALVADSILLPELIELIKSYNQQLSDLIKGIYLLSELSNRSIAKVVSYGELLSTAILSYALKGFSINSKLLDSRDFIVTDENYMKGEPDFVMTKEKAENIITPFVNDGFIPVVQGFIGRTVNGEVSTLGRGGSDFTASILGNVLDAEEIEIWTDVDGILTADPGKVKGVKIVEEISFKEAAELAYFGAKVLHPSTIIPAIEKNIPVRILNSHQPGNAGTVVLSQVESEGKSIRAITSKEFIKVVNIYSPKMLFAHGFLKKIFEVFDKYKTSVDVITTSEVNVSLTIDNDENLDSIIKELAGFSEVETDDQKSLICIVGSNIKYTKGLAKRIFHVLEDFNITMISQGASVINLSFVVDRDVLVSVLQKLHDEFFGEE